MGLGRADVPAAYFCASPVTGASGKRPWCSRATPSATTGASARPRPAGPGTPGGRGRRARLHAEYARDGAYNAWYDRPAVLALAGDVRGLRVLDAACGPGLYAEQLLARGGGQATLAR